MKIGKTLRNKRRQLGMSQMRLAFYAEVSPEYIGKIERGIIKNVGFQTLLRILEVLKLPLSDLLPSKEKQAA